MQIELLKQIPFFRGTSTETILEFLEDAPLRVHTYQTRDIIAHQGDSIRGLLLLLSGSVRGQMTNPEGKRLTIDTIHAPEILASAFVYGTVNQFPVTIEALEASEVWHVDREYFLKFMGRHTTVMREFLRVISDRSNFLSSKINTLNLQSLRERLLSYIKTNPNFGKQEDLALQLGVARPSLARLLGELLDEGVLIKDANGYRLATK